MLGKMLVQARRQRHSHISYYWMLLSFFSFAFGIVVLQNFQKTKDVRTWLRKEKWSPECIRSDETTKLLQRQLGKCNQAPLWFQSVQSSNKCSVKLPGTLYLWEETSLVHGNTSVRIRVFSIKYFYKCSITFPRFQPYGKQWYPSLRAVVTKPFVAETSKLPSFEDILDFVWLLEHSAS